MRTAHWSFSVIVRPTERNDDILHTYRKFHFQQAWDQSDSVDLRTFEAILERKKNRDRTAKERKKDILARFRGHTLNEQQINQAVEEAIAEVRSANSRLPGND